MTTTYTDYMEEKKRFFNKHHYDYKVYTGSLDKYDRYTKTYAFSDGANWEEVMTPVVEKATASVHGIDVKVDVKLLKIEYWSTESCSKYYYEKY